MRVDPLYVPNLVGSLDNVAASEQTLSGELSSGSRVTQLSDDPAAAADNVVLTAQIAQDADAGGLIVDESARAAIRPQYPTENEILVPSVGQTLLI